MEWFRNPQSKLETTLRLPILIKYSLILLVTRILPRLFIFGIIIYFMSGNLWLSATTAFLVTFLIEMFTLRAWLLNVILPRHLKNLETVRRMLNDLDKDSSADLIKKIEDSVKFSSWAIINIGYVALPSYGWEIIFKFAHKLLVGRAIPYQELLIGFYNKSIEADQALWKVAQERNVSRKSFLRSKFLNEYGSRVDDIDLSKPTLREQPQVVDQLIQLYKNTISPKARLQEAAAKRQKAEAELWSKLFIPKYLFLPFLRTVQKNVQLREDRRFWEFLMDFYIRQMLFKLAVLRGVKRQMIFTKSWRNLKHAATN